MHIRIAIQALLTRLAQTPAGAQALLQLGLIAKLSQCQFLDLRPEPYSRTHTTDGMFMDDEYFVPSVLERYRQLILPALKLVVSVLTSAGRQNRDVTGQVSFLALRFPHWWCMLAFACIWDS